MKKVLRNFMDRYCIYHNLSMFEHFAKLFSLIFLYFNRPQRENNIRDIYLYLLVPTERPTFSGSFGPKKVTKFVNFWPLVKGWSEKC